MPGMLSLAGAVFLLALVGVAAAATGPVTPVWLAPVELTPRADRSVYDSDVAVDPRENMLAVWGGVNGVTARFRPAGAAWQAPVQLATCGFGARVEFDAAGNATIAWLQCENGIGARVTAAVRRVDGGWSAAVPLSTPGREAGYLRLHVAGSGAAVASWGETDGRVWVVQASTRAPVLETWTPAVQLSAIGADAYESSSAVDDTGDVVVGWTRGDPAGPIVWTAYKPSSGAWQGALNMSPSGEYATDITVAIRAGGDAFAVWNESGEGRWARRDAADGTWSQAAPFPTYSAHDLVVDGVGDILAVWDDYRGIFGAAMEAGTTVWGPVFEVASPPNLVSYSVGFDQNRALVAVWGSWTASGQGLVTASRRAAGAGDWQQPIIRAVDGSFSSYYEAGYALDGAGNVVATYVAPNYSAVGTVVLDAAAPQVKSLSFHQTGRVGQKLLFGAEPFDISAVSFRWYFGDRHNASGASVTHVYRKAGRYAISLIATDAAGHRITVARTSVRVRR